MIWLIVLISVSHQALAAQATNSGNLSENEIECGELAEKCVIALENADTIIELQGNKINILELQTKQLNQFLADTNQKVVDLENPPWYSNKTTFFILGLISGILIVK